MTTQTIIRRTLKNPQYAGKTLELAVQRTASTHHTASVFAVAVIEGKVVASHLRPLSPAESAEFARRGVQGVTHFLGTFPVFAAEAQALEAAVAAQLDGTNHRGWPVAIATVQDHADDGEVQAAYARAVETGQQVLVRTEVEEAHRPGIESSQDFVDLYVLPSGRLDAKVRHAY